MKFVSIKAVIKSCSLKEMINTLTLFAKSTSHFPLYFFKSLGKAIYFQGTPFSDNLIEFNNKFALFLRTLQLLLEATSRITLVKRC